jgi:hypothetical protein
MAKQAKPSNKPKLETPQDGDLVMVVWRDHRTGHHWDSGMIYREKFIDSERVITHQTVIYDPDYSIIGSRGELAGTLAGEWKDVEFWCVWKGESRQEHSDRIKDLNLTHDEWFQGEKDSPIRGGWSRPKIAPPFIQVSIQDKWTRPKDGTLVEVHAREGYLEPQRGRYFAAADMIYREERLGTRRVEVKDMSPLDPQTMRMGIAVLFDQVKSIPNNVKIETTFSDRFRYSPPFLPFSNWVQFRGLKDDGTPCTDWEPGPHSEEWANQERIRRTTTTIEQNEERYENLRAMVLDSYPTEPDLRMRLVRSKQLHKNAPNAGFDRSLDPDILKSVYEQHYKTNKISKEQYERNTSQLIDGLSGGGEFFLSKWVDFLQSEILTLEEALHIGSNGAQRNHLYELMIGPDSTAFDAGLIEKVGRGEQTEEETRQIIHSISEASKRREIENQLKGAKELAAVQVLAEKIGRTNDHSVTLDEVAHEERYSKDVASVAAVVGVSSSMITKAIREGEKILGLTPIIQRKGVRGKIWFADSFFERLEGKKNMTDSREKR